MIGFYFGCNSSIFSDLVSILLGFAQVGSFFVWVFQIQNFSEQDILRFESFYSMSDFIGQNFVLKFFSLFSGSNFI